MRKVVVLVAALLVIDVERADACSCGPENPTIVPTDRATGVVINPLIVVRVVYPTVTTLLQTSAGQNVDIDIEEPVPGYRILKPRAPLSANTQYEVLVEGEPSTFSTGDQRDDTPPPAATLRAITPQTMSYPPARGCVSTCVISSAVEDGHVSRMGVDHDLASDAVFAVIELRSSTKPDAVVRVPVAEFLGFQRCLPLAPILDPEATYCGRIVSYDAAGNTTSSDEVCSEVARCEPIESDGPGIDCQPAPICKPVSSGGCAVGGGRGGWLAVLVLALSRGWSRRSARRRRIRATPPAP